MGKAPGGGGGAPTFTATANMTHQVLGFASPATFTNVNTGTGLVVVAVEFEAGASGISGITLNTGGGAVAMTQAAQTTWGASATRNAAIFYLAGQTASATSTVVITGGNFNTIGMQAAVLTGVTATPTSTAVTNFSNPASPYIIGSASSITVPASGFGVGAFFVQQSATYAAGTGLTIDYDLDDSTALQSILGHMGPGASQTCSVTSAANFNNFAGAFAAWGP